MKIYTKDELIQLAGPEKANAAIEEQKKLAKAHGGKPGLIWERDPYGKRRMITLSISNTYANDCIRIPLF